LWPFLSLGLPAQGSRRTIATGNTKSHKNDSVAVLIRWHVPCYLTTDNTDITDEDSIAILSSVSSGAIRGPSPIFGLRTGVHRDPTHPPLRMDGPPDPSPFASFVYFVVRPVS
jgi:hypothetical protein